MKFSFCIIIVFIAIIIKVPVDIISKETKRTMPISGGAGVIDIASTISGITSLIQLANLWHPLVNDLNATGATILISAIFRFIVALLKVINLIAATFPPLLNVEDILGHIFQMYGI